MHFNICLRLLPHLLDHAHGVDVPLHLGARDGHEPAHGAEGLVAHAAVHLLQPALQHGLLRLVMWGINAVMATAEVT